MALNWAIALIFVICAVHALHTNVLHSPDAVATVREIHNKLTLNMRGKDYSSSVQALIDRVLTANQIPFRFQPKIEMIEYDEVDGQPFDVFEIDSEGNSTVVLR
ncbi:hypothetical protein EON65_08480 [archaeon]|nr:MAG: hypothetical protein EON65_08480 [archaeon]